MKNFSKIASIAAVATLATAPMATAASLLIDDFTTAQEVGFTPSGIVPQSSQVNGPGILGGYRDMWVNTIGPNTTLGTKLEAGTVFDPEGELQFSNADAVVGQGLIVYDGSNVATSLATINPLGLGGIDFTLGGLFTWFEFEVSSFESDLLFEAVVSDMTGGSAWYTEILPPIGLFSPILPLTDFVGTVDWTDVGALAFRVTAQGPGYDGAIKSIKISAIPLPASALLLLGGLGGLAGLSAAAKRRRAS